MPVRLKSKDIDFEAQFVELLGLKREVSVDVDNAVRKIVNDVRTHGDEALRDLTLKFDRLDLRKTGTAVSHEEVEAAYAACSDRKSVV